MAEHASIFYATPVNKYLLCTDSELDRLVARRTRSSLFRSRLFLMENLQPFEVSSDKAGHCFMRLIYNPKRTEHLRRPDGYIDRFVEFDEDWLNNRIMAFELAFPAGLPLDLISKYKKPDTDC